MCLFAQGGGGYGANEILTPWEIHPMLVHFPVALLLAGVAVSAYAHWRSRIDLERAATRLLIAGLIIGALAALAGFLAFYTLPEAHTELAHSLMYWHLIFQAVSLVLFGWVAWVRWRGWQMLPAAKTQGLMWVATLVFVIGSGIGGHMVYHGGAGIDAQLMKPGLHEEEHQGPSHHHSYEPPAEQVGQRD